MVQLRKEIPYPITYEDSPPLLILIGPPGPIVQINPPPLVPTHKVPRACTLEDQVVPCLHLPSLAETAQTVPHAQPPPPYPHVPFPGMACTYLLIASRPHFVVLPAPRPTTLRWPALNRFHNARTPPSVTCGSQGVSQPALANTSAVSFPETTTCAFSHASRRGIPRPAHSPIISTTAFKSAVLAHPHAAALHTTEIAARESDSNNAGANGQDSSTTLIPAISPSHTVATFLTSKLLLAPCEPHYPPTTLSNLSLLLSV